MKTGMSLTAAILALTALVHPMEAQTTSSDEAEVLAVVQALFDGMRAADSAAVRSTLHPEVRLAGVTEGENGPVLRVDSMEGFVNAVGTPHDEIWDERTWDPQVRVDGRLATVWVSYAFYLGESLSHCGVDAFQLFKSADGWKIFQIADTRRREGCEIPEAVSGG